MEVREILRQLQMGQSVRAIAKAMTIDRKTATRYQTWAIEQDLLDKPLPSLGELNQLLAETLKPASPPQNVSSVEPYRELVKNSYSSVRRFVRRLEPLTPEVTVRVETRPGEEAQVDFGYAGRMIDPETGQLRKTWAFVTPALAAQVQV